MFCIKGEAVSELILFVDYDNIEQSLTRAGPVSLAKTLVALAPSALISRHSIIIVRLYGGWRVGSTLTTLAQRLIPDIRANSPCIVNVSHAGASLSCRLIVELADKPIGTSVPFEHTLVKDRVIRKFKALATPWPNCIDTGSCGFHSIAGLAYSTKCSNGGCAAKLEEIFVRDEQKMVDTLIVADIAHQTYVEKASDIVVVSSDTDMWPGILLALRAGCFVTHIHTKPGWRTQRHLIGTLIGRLNHQYQQLSV